MFRSIEIKIYIHLFQALLSFVAFGNISGLRAQEPEKIRVVQIPVSSYNVEEGLGQSTVYQVLQDNRGLIWLVSGGGLQYFDGSGFRSFYPAEEVSAKTQGKTLRGLLESGTSQLTLSSGNSILGFDMYTGNFSMTGQNSSKFLFLLNHNYNGKPVCWVYSEGLFSVSEDSLTPVPLHWTDGDILPEEFMPFKSILSPEGNLLMVSANGYVELRTGEPEANEAQAIYHPLRFRCSDVVRDPAGNIYFLARGIIYLLEKNGTLNAIFDTGIEDGAYLFRDRTGQFWVSDIQNRKVYRMSERGRELIRFISRQGRFTDTIQAAVRHFFEDRNGNLWLGTDGSGLLFYSPGQLTFNLALTGFARCIEDFGGDIWTGTFKNGLWRSPYDLSASIRVRPDIFTDEFYFFDLMADTAGRLWAATDNGLYVLDRGGNVSYHVPFRTTAARFLILSGHQPLLSVYGELYSCMTGPAPSLTFLREQTQVREVVISNHNLLTGCDYGLFITDAAKGILAALDFDPGDRLTETPVYSILPIDSTLWAGTESGIVLFNGHGAELPLPSFLEDLKHEIVYSLVKDSRNRIWFSSNKGLGCIPGEMDRVIRFYSGNNLQSSEFNFNASLATSRGMVYFGGIRGINGVAAGQFEIPGHAPEVRLISLNVSDTSLTTGVPLENPVIRLHRQRPHISGEVFNPDYLPTGTALFSFFLEGYHDHWTPPAAENRFSYRNLPPGEYTLMVKCMDSYKNEGAPSSLLRIIIRPPFWTTWWFILLASLTGISLTAFIIKKIQGARYRRKLEDLERRNAIVRERLRIAQDMHDDIGASLTQISILSEILKKQDHPDERQKIIWKISNISGSVIDELGEIIWAINPGNDNLSSFVSYLRRHASEYLSNAGMTGVLSFPDEVPAVTMTSEQRRNIYLVVKEAIHNAVRHSGADEVRISLIWHDPSLIMRIEDNGIGFRPEERMNAGNGLPGMKKRIESLGGNFSISARPGEGTVILLEVMVR